MNKGKTILASIELEKNDDGYLARIPGVQGAFAEGDTIEEAVFNLIDVAKMIFAYRRVILNWAGLLSDTNKV
jgi:predicted RNase H-like HicB family nuclease